MGPSADRPRSFCAALIAATTLAYVPLAMVFSPWDWGGFLGPLSLQLSRPLHYTVYFLAAFTIGSDNHRADDHPEQRTCKQRRAEFRHADSALQPSVYGPALMLRL